MLSALVASLAFVHPLAPIVAVVPFQNVSGEKWDELRTKVTTSLEKSVREQLTNRKCVLVEDAKIEMALREAKWDLGDEESWRRDSFYDLGRAVGADLVVFGVVTAQSQKMRQNAFSSVPEGEVTAKIWALDVANRQPIISAKTFSDKARAKGSLSKGSRAQEDAAARLGQSAFQGLYDLLDGKPAKAAG